MRIGTDRRFFERIEGEFAVRYSPYGSNKEFCTTSRNISGVGIRITLLKKLKPGTLLDLEIFKYNTDIKARCRGKIVWVWSEPQDKESNLLYDAGIQFMEKELLYIGRLVNYLKNKS